MLLVRWSWALQTLAPSHLSVCCWLCGVQLIGFKVPSYWPMNNISYRFISAGVLKRVQYVFTCWRPKKGTVCVHMAYFGHVQIKQLQGKQHGLSTPSHMP